MKTPNRNPRIGRPTFVSSLKPMATESTRGSHHAVTSRQTVVIQRSVAIGVLTLLSLVGPVAGQSEWDDRQLAFFEGKIRPVLIEHCYECHSQEADEIQGGLALDTREGLLAGGDTGPALESRRGRASILMQALRHEDDLAMPPDQKLPEEVIADFERWIRMGAPDPRDGQTLVASEEIDIEAGRNFWAFQPPTQPEIPKASPSDWPYGDIDQFVLTELQANDLKPVGDADPHTLIRRIYFDLIGLPPSPAELDRFVDAYRVNPREAVASAVDHLLESPQFGERWARHWLDVARFGESSGGASNQSFPHAWRYRDYVIQAFNNDKPYDEFIREQLAGDLLNAKNDQDHSENLIATGFLAIGSKPLNERNPRQFRADVADEQIDATFLAFQALTVACARCHDHKFDPIPQADYYALAGIFYNTETCYGTVRSLQSNHPSELIELPEIDSVTEPENRLSSRRRQQLESQITRLERRIDDGGAENDPLRRRIIGSQVTLLQSQLDAYNQDGSPRLLAMGVRDRRFVFDIPILIRGEIDQRGDRVPRGFPQVLTTAQPEIARRNSGRLELADWIASPDNPLTARVMVNRVWLHLMGRGLVPTPDNFGASGLPPSHPELLDYLAVRFVDNGWSIKQLIRDVMLSRTYQLATTYDEANYTVDPDNQWYWRMPKRRLEAEAIRDSMLFLSGNLNESPPVGSPVAQLGEGNVALLMRMASDDFAELENRSIYLPIVRGQLPDVLTVFDFPDPSLIMGQRSTTTIPAQALYLMNNPFVLEQAEGLADRLLAVQGRDTDKIRFAYKMCLSRMPNSRELSNATSFVRRYGQDHSTRATWSALSQALFTSAEFTQR